MTGSNLVLDTNIVLGYLSGKAFAVDFLNEHPEDDLFVSAITRMELLSFPEITDDEEQAVTEFLDCVGVMPVDPVIENAAIQIRRATKRKLPDCIIAATALRLEATLVTCDSQLANTEYPGLVTLDPSLVK